MNTKLQEDYQLHFISKDFQFLTQQKKIEYKGVNLKCSYIIDIINELLTKFYFSNNVDVSFNLFSTILRERYGEHYNYYIGYLCDNGFMSLVSKYYVGKKANTYKIDSKSIYDVVRWKNYDKFLLKKNKNRQEISITETNKSIIHPNIRVKLVDSLSKIKIDYEGSLNYLNGIKDLIGDSKYHKNLISIENIKEKNIYFNFDDFGRFHTNFTILKKEIRNKFLTIDNEIITEIDIKNSQPLFFAVLLKDELRHINGDTKRYFELVKSGLLYDDIIANSQLTNRSEAKELIYKVLFGPVWSKTNKVDNMIFKKIYPSVYEYICEYKELRDNYKELSHDLQRLESDFIFNKVIKEIFETYPDITLFTVHDSIIFPKSYQEKIEIIFNNHFQILIKNI